VLAIDIFRGLLGDDTFDEVGLNKTPIPGDILNKADDRDWYSWTGIRILNSSEFPQDERSYVDDGYTKINTLTAVNQKKIDNCFPIPPNF
jgi:hypothetical protein